MLDAIINGVSKLAPPVIGGFNAIGSMLQGKDEADIARDNLALQRDNLDWQKSMQAESWRRDDNAVQRRVQDLSAAGINPLLAAGSAAGNASVVSTQAPQLDSRAAAKGGVGGMLSAGGSKLMDAMMMSKEFAVKDAQAQLLQAQASNVETDTMLKGSQNTGLVMQNDVYRLNNLFDLDSASDLKRGLVAYNRDVYRSVDRLVNRLESQKAKAAGELAQNQAIERLTAAGLDKATAEALAAGYSADVMKNMLEVSNVTLPAQIAGPYADVAGKVLGSTKSLLSLDVWLKSFLERNVPQK